MPTTLPRNIVKLPTDPRQHKISMSEDAMNILRLRMYSWDAKELAEATGVSLGCIYAIRSGTTKWPRPSTLFPLLQILGLEMYLRDISNRHD